MTKEEEILAFLDDKVFQPILTSANAPKDLKAGARITRQRMSKLNAEKIIQYYWSAIVGTEKSINFARNMKASGFVRFEEVLEEFRNKFDDKFLRTNS